MSVWAYHLADGLGSMRQLADSAGNVTLAQRYDPFGGSLTSAGSGTSVYGFTGEQRDATGLVYLRARYYAPTQGRFTTKDSWTGDYNKPMSYNAWPYAYANPVNRSDPAGLFPNVPRYPGVCEDPPLDHRKSSVSELLGKGVDQIYIYCGQFSLTQYVFVDSEETYLQKSTSKMLTSNIQERTTPRIYETSDLFIEDIRMNGTGYSERICGGSPGGYFTVPFPPSGNRFEVLCGKGRPFDKDRDAFKKMAADRRLFPRDVTLWLPEMCSSCNNEFEVRDTGGAFTSGNDQPKIYRLDIFAGQGPGPQSGLYYGNPKIPGSGSIAWQFANVRNDPRLGMGASAYQRVPPELFSLYLQLLLCDPNETYPLGSRGVGGGPF